MQFTARSVGFQRKTWPNPKTPVAGLVVVVVPGHSEQGRPREKDLKNIKNIQYILGL